MQLVMTDINRFFHHTMGLSDLSAVSAKFF